MYQIKPRGIKKIIKSELENKFDDIRLKSISYNDFIRELKYDLFTQLDNCQSYDDLEIFVDKYYRMSLNDWVESL